METTITGLKESAKYSTTGTTPTQKKYHIKKPTLYNTTGKYKGLVYAIQVGDYIKIGRTSSLKKRLQSYLMHPPFAYEVLFTKETLDTKCMEAALQHCFLKYQYKGEWFKFPQETLLVAKEKINSKWEELEAIVKQTVKEYESKT